jgi:hypothetical protein
LFAGLSGSEREQFRLLLIALRESLSGECASAPSEGC